MHNSENKKSFVELIADIKPNSYFALRIHNLAYISNFSALSLLGIYIGRYDNPFSQIPHFRYLFIPFLLGILLAGFASFFAAIELEAHKSYKKRLKHQKKRELKMESLEAKIFDSDSKNADLEPIKGRQLSVSMCCHTIALILAVFCFLIGIAQVGFPEFKPFKF